MTPISCLTPTSVLPLFKPKPHVNILKEGCVPWTPLFLFLAFDILPLTITHLFHCHHWTGGLWGQSELGFCPDVRLLLRLAGLKVTEDRCSPHPQFII